MLGFTVATFLYVSANVPEETTLYVPFFKDVAIQLGGFYLIITYFMVVGFSNAVNLTDGVSFMYERPMTLGLLIIGLLLIFVPAYRRRRARALQQGVAPGD